MFGGLKISETAHVKDLVAHLKVLLNPRDELARNRVLQLLPGVGSVSADRLGAQAAAAGTTAADAVDDLGASAPSRPASDRLRRLAEALRKAAACDGIG